MNAEPKNLKTSRPTDSFSARASAVRNGARLGRDGSRRDALERRGEKKADESRCRRHHAARRISQEARAENCVEKREEYQARVARRTRAAPAIARFNGWVQSIVFHPTDKLLFASDSWAGSPARPTRATRRSRTGTCRAHDGAIAASQFRRRQVIATCGRISSCASGILPTASPSRSTSNERRLRLTFSRRHANRVGDLFAKISCWISRPTKSSGISRRAFLHLWHADVAVAHVMFLDAGRTLLAGCNPRRRIRPGVPVLMDSTSQGKPPRSAARHAKEGFVTMSWASGRFPHAVTSGQPVGKLVLLRPRKRSLLTLTAGWRTAIRRLHPTSALRGDLDEWRQQCNGAGSPRWRVPGNTTAAPLRDSGVRLGAD